MAERIISVKMPRSLVRELDKQRTKHHYLDLSEQLRSIVRRKCIEHTNPYTTAIKQVRTDIEQQTGTTQKEQLLQHILKLLKEEDT